MTDTVRPSVPVHAPSRTSAAIKLASRWGNYLFLLPAVIFMLAFMVFPILYNILLSFQNVTLMNLKGIHSFVGFSNYAAMFRDSLFYESFRNSAVFTGICIFFQFMIGFALALFFNRNFPGRNVMRSLMLLAWMLPIVITATLFKWILAGDNGIANYLLLLFGLTDHSYFWLSEASLALYGTIIANIWIGIPFNMIILLSGLQSLPIHLYEAARIDGASRFRQFLNITLPLLKPTMLILLMLGLIYTFKVFDLIFIMTGGGPLNASTVFPLYAYRLAFINFEFSLGATVSSFMFFLLILLSVGYLWLARKEEHD
jgi:multiple sugar transport system permease protein